MTEHEIQVAVFKWAEYAKCTLPELNLMFAIPNESYGQTKRDVIRGMKFKKEGRKAGVPDICLPVARNGYHGMFIEMKSAKGRPSKQQKWWIERLKEQGYAVYVCNSFEDAVKTITDYLHENND